MNHFYNDKSVKPLIFKNNNELVEYVYHRYHKRVAAYFINEGQGQDVEDTLQKFYIKLLNLNMTEPFYQFKSFIFTVAQNLLIDKLRRIEYRNSKKTDSFDFFDDHYNIDFLVYDGLNDKILSEKNMISDLFDYIALFSDPMKTIFVQHRIHQIPHKELAIMFSMTVSAIEKHMINANILISEFNDIYGKSLDDMLVILISNDANKINLKYKVRQKEFFLTDKNIQDFLAKRKALLINEDIEAIKKLYPRIKSDHQAEIVLHKTRYECTDIHSVLRHQSRDWLINNKCKRLFGLPWPPNGELPD